MTHADTEPRSAAGRPRYSPALSFGPASAAASRLTRRSELMGDGKTLSWKFIKRTETADAVNPSAGARLLCRPGVLYSP